MSELERRLREALAREGREVLIPGDAQLEQTLRSLMHRIAMILEAEGCVFLLFDPSTGELAARPPAVGLQRHQIRRLRVDRSQGVSGEVFRRHRPAVVRNILTNPQAKQEFNFLSHVRNTVCVPLQVEVEDAERQLISRQTIGVLHAFNKRREEGFNDQDVRLLTVLSRTLAVILYHAIAFEALSKQTDLQRE